MTASRPGVRRFTVTETREAMEVRDDNLEEVAAWCGGTVERNVQYPDASGVNYPNCSAQWDGGDATAFVGYVLVKHDGGFYDVPVEMFDRHSADWTEEKP